MSLDFPRSVLRRLPAQQAGDGVLAGAALQFLVLGGAGELLEGVLGLECRGAVEGGPGLDELQRATAAGVTGTGAALVLRQPARQVVRDAAVEAAVGTAQDVEVPGHGEEIRNKE